MSTTPTDRPVRPGSARSVRGRLRRLLARIGAAVRSAHSASVPF